MASKLRTWGVPISIVIGSLLIAFAYVLPHLSGSQISAAVSPSKAEANSTDDLLKSLATKDSDGDGLPDWEEVLYGTDPNKVISTKFGVPDGEAVKEGLLSPKNAVATSTNATDIPQPAPAADSLTDAFAKTFFEQYMQISGGQPLTADEQNNLVTTLVTQFVAGAPPVISSYATSSIQVSTSVATSTYIHAVEVALTSEDAGLTAKDAEPLTLTQSFVESGDASASPKLVVLSQAYASVASALAAMPVPPAFLTGHLALTQAFDILAKATSAMTGVNSDPLRTLINISAYQTAPKNTLYALKNIVSVQSQSGTPQKGEPGYMLLTYVNTLGL